jgi:hypothetical protein
LTAIIKQTRRRSYFEKARNQGVRSVGSSAISLGSLC